MSKKKFEFHWPKSDISKCRFSFCGVPLLEGEQSVYDVLLDKIRSHAIIKDGDDVVSGDKVLRYTEKGFRPIADNLMFNTKDEQHLIHMPYGLTIVAGGTNTGKSTLLRYMQQNLECPYVYFGEPEIPALTSKDELMSELKSFLLDDERQTMIIDGFTSLTIATKGDTAGSGGISLNFLQELCGLSTLCIAANKHIIASVNTLSFDESIHNQIESRVTGYYKITASGSLTYSGRFSPTSRIPKTIHYTLGDLGVIDNNIDENDIDALTNNIVFYNKDRQ